MTIKDIKVGALVSAENPVTRELWTLYIREIRDGKVILARSLSALARQTRWAVPVKWLKEHGTLVRHPDPPPAPPKRARRKPAGNTEA